MSDTVIRVENLGKKYVIGHQQQERYTALRDVLANKAKDITQIFNPNAKRQKPTSEEFWALKDVSFEVKRGDRIGIIGRNGAGKSTLLKILSRITEPTEGRISIKGRVASLLEVGTGFHPELTGRENIYLNGAILGMSKVEILRKFDEIVAFAEVEKFLDMPVKRYSSGMYVRLAFAVAAHLEPEILIVDEVLAVGDSNFQKKCLGKMKEVSQEGRTIIFVSHNMAAIRTLCTRSILMKDGQITLDLDPEAIIADYLMDGESSDSFTKWDRGNAPQSPELIFLEAYIQNEERKKASTIDCRKSFSITVKFQVRKPVYGLRIGFFMQNSEGVPICGSNKLVAEADVAARLNEYEIRCFFPGHLLNKGRYSVYFGADVPPYSNFLVATPYCISIIVEDVEGHGPKHEHLPGLVRPKLEWELKELLETQ